MSTVSIRSRDRRAARRAARAAKRGRAHPVAPPAELEQDAADERSTRAQDTPRPPSDGRPPDQSTDLGQADRTFLILGIAILGGAALLRLWNLELKPFHNDEGVNGWFLMNLARTGRYTYDPANYHGPALYYLAWIPAWLFGLTDAAVRLVPALCGIGTVGLVLLFRRWIGPVGALVGAALLAVSPGAVFVSRYFIHESPLVFFSVALVWFALRYGEAGRATWAILAAAAAALMFTTKETAIVTLAIYLIAWACTSGLMRIWRWRRLVPGRSRPPAQPGRGANRREFAAWRAATAERLGGGRRILDTWLGAALVFAAIYVLLFSSFATNIGEGLSDSLKAFAIWTQTGGATQVQPLFAYLNWMVQQEIVLLTAGGLGIALAWWRGTDRVSIFVGFWAIGLAAAYSLITYKTPWLILNWLVPAAIAAGYGAQQLLNAAYGRVRRARRRPPVRVAWAATGVVGLALGVGLYQSVVLNFERYDDDRLAYVYVGTRRDVFAMLGELDRIAATSGDGRRTGIVVTTPDYWPLPWYLRNYPRAGMFGRLVPTKEPAVVIDAEQEDELDSEFVSLYQRVREYSLRPGVDLVLYVRSDVAARL